MPHAVADISSPPRTIEVKAASGNARGQDIWLEPLQYQAAISDPNFYVYVVDNIVGALADLGQFQLHILGDDHLARLLTRAKLQSYYLVPWLIRDYDAWE